MITLYDLKPKFQDLLRPLVSLLATKGITENFITVLAVIGSLIIGLVLYTHSDNATLFLILPVWMLIRMALNAIDGMLAREFAQKTNLGAYLNEMTDVIADIALFLPFTLITPFTADTVIVVIFLVILTEFSGVLAATIGATRRYDGPMGKSDRALLLSILALWIGTNTILPNWMYWLMPVMSCLLIWTIFNRINRALISS